MELPRKKAVQLLRATCIFLCKLVFADVVCSLVFDWMLYLIIGVSELASKSSKKSPGSGAKDTSGIQVIVCGISRSGSMSLWHAMNILGFPCLHGVHLIKPTNCKLFTKAMASGSYKDWQLLLHDYKAIADFPAASAFKQLMNVYPNAKVILNMRDPNSWYRSFSETILNISSGFEFQLIQPCLLRCYNKFLYQNILKGTPENQNLSIQNYLLHVDEVKKHVPTDKLYVFELESNQGWDDLCSFLNVPIPNVPFPIINDKLSFQKQFTWKIKFLFRTIIITYMACILYGFIHFFKWISCKEHDA